MTFAGVRLAEITESRAYKEIVAIGHEQGLQEGLQEGLREGRQGEAAALVLRLLTHRFGGITEAQQTTLRSLPTERLEALAEALLDFHSAADLEDWLRNHQPG